MYLFTPKQQTTKATAKPWSCGGSAYDPEESRDQRAILLALHMQIGSKLGTANSLNLAGFNTSRVVSSGWIISSNRRHGTSCTIKLPIALPVILHARPAYSVSTPGLVCWWREVHPAQISGKTEKTICTTNKVTPAACKALLSVWTCGRLSV